MEQLAYKNSMLNHYFGTLIDRIFKILPLYEEENEGLFKYTHSLLFELYGLQYVVEGMDVDSEYITLLATLESLSDEVTIFDDSEIVKREVFKCIGVINRIREKMVN